MQCLRIAVQPAEAVLEDASSAAKGIRYGEARIRETTLLRRCVADSGVAIAWYR